MKKILTFAILLCSIGFVKAQTRGTVGVNLYGSYNFQETVNLDYADVKISDGLQYGLGLEYFIRPSKSIELKYNRQDANYDVTQYNIGPNTYYSGKGSLNYILIGGNNYFISNPGAKAVPYLGLSLGLGIVNGGKSSSEHFAWDIHGGVKLKTSGPVSVKLQAYLQEMVSSYGYDYYYYYAYPDYKSVLQFGLGAVLTFDFDK